MNHHTPHPSPASAWAMAILVTAVWCLLLAFFHQAEDSPEAEAAAAYSRAWAAAQVCGQNAAHQWEGEDLQCLTKHGRRTGPRYNPQQVAALALQGASK